MAAEQNTHLCDHDASADLLPSRPWDAVYYHYGMLLGVEDFVTEQSYHRGKMRLHNAWLHGPGVVWGLKVSADVPRGELRVEPGLALDGFGRELHSAQPQCVNIGRWFAVHREDAGFNFNEATDGTITLDAHVVLRHRACLMRPVPALLDTCAGATSQTAYSRVQETFELLLRPGLAPAPKLRNRLLRVLVGLEPPAKDDDGNVLPDDQAALDAAAKLAATPSDQWTATAVAVLQHITVLDSLAQEPTADEDDVEAGLFPKEAVGEVVLANASGMTLSVDAADPQNVKYALTGATVDNLVRQVLLTTQTLQWLIAAGLLGGAAADEIGPRVLAESVDLTGTTLSFRVDRPLQAKSVTAAAFAAASFDAVTGWSALTVKDVEVAADGLSVTMTLDPDPGAATVRFVAFGTGAQPLLGDNNLPLFGAVAAGRLGRAGGAAAALHGCDFVWMR
jgi:hypothetical protein